MVDISGICHQRNDGAGVKQRLPSDAGDLRVIAEKVHDRIRKQRDKGGADDADDRTEQRGEPEGLPRPLLIARAEIIPGDRLEALRESDAILREEFAKNGLAGKVWQYFTVVPDFKSTGVKDGARTYDWPVIIRAFNTKDAMTATVEYIPFALLCHITARITAEVKGVNRVLYDLTPKPTGPIEWE